MAKKNEPREMSIQIGDSPKLAGQLFKRKGSPNLVIVVPADPDVPESCPLVVTVMPVPNATPEHSASSSGKTVNLANIGNVRTLEVDTFIGPRPLDVFGGARLRIDPNKDAPRFAERTSASADDDGAADDEPITLNGIAIG